VHPKGEPEVNFLDFWWAGETGSVGVVNLAVLACVVRVATKKRSLTFLRKKCTAPEKIQKSWLRLDDNGDYCMSHVSTLLTSDVNHQHTGRSSLSLLAQMAELIV